MKCGIIVRNMDLRRLKMAHARSVCKAKRLTSMTPEERRIAMACRRLVAAARKIWGWDSERRAVLNKAEELAQPDVLKSKRDRRLCVSCRRTFDKKEVHADHIKPVGAGPKSFKGWDDYYTRLFARKDNIQPLCTVCHKTKTRADMKQIRGNCD